MTLAAAVCVDVASILGPGLGDQLAASLVVPLVPRCQVADDQFVDVAHGILLPFGCLLLRSVWKIRPGSPRGDYPRGHKIRARGSIRLDLCIDRKVGSGPL